MGCVVLTGEEIIAACHVGQLPFDNRTHVSAGKISFVFIKRFKYSPCTAHHFACCGSDGLFVGGPTCRRAGFIAIPVLTAVHFSELVIRTHAVDLAIRRNEMENITTDAACRTAEP